MKKIKIKIKRGGEGEIGMLGTYKDSDEINSHSEPVYIENTENQTKQALKFSVGELQMMKCIYIINY